MDKQDLRKKIEKHAKWMMGMKGGEMLILVNADLRGSNLSGSNLRGCDLRDCDLRWCAGNIREIKSMQLDKWPVVYTHDMLCIGCQQHKIADWWSFTDARIGQMAPGALEWWKIWKPALQQIISLSPATPTEHEE